MSRAALIVIAAIALAVTPAQAAPLKDYGPLPVISPPAPENWGEVIDDYLNGSLKDPYSAVKRVTRGPRYGEYRRAFMRYTGWMICMTVNAKNSYGGYTGAKRYLFLIDPDYSLSVFTPDFDGDVAISRPMDAECARAADPVNSEDPATNPKFGL